MDEKAEADKGSSEQLKVGEKTEVDQAKDDASQKSGEANKDIVWIARQKPVGEDICQDWKVLFWARSVYGNSFGK